MGCMGSKLQPTGCCCRVGKPILKPIQDIPPEQTLSLAQLEETIVTGRPLVLLGYDAKDMLYLFEKQNRIRITERIVDPSLLRILQRPMPSQPNKKELTKIIHEWYEFFDEVFFFGNVKRHRLFRINLVKKSSPPDDEKDLGHYTTGMITIFIEAHESLTVEWKCKVLHVMISTLLHEMLHAFLSNYVTYVTDKEEEGEHGPTFSNILAILEERLEREVDFKIDCGIWRSVASSMLMDYWRGSEADMKRWGAPDEDFCLFSRGGVLHDPHSAESEDIRKQMLDDE